MGWPFDGVMLAEFGWSFGSSSPARSWAFRQLGQPAYDVSCPSRPPARRFCKHPRSFRHDLKTPHKWITRSVLLLSLSCVHLTDSVCTV